MGGIPGDRQRGRSAALSFVRPGLQLIARAALQDGRIRVSEQPEVLSGLWAPSNRVRYRTVRVHSLSICVAFAAAGLLTPMVNAQMRGGLPPVQSPMGTQPGNPTTPGINGTPGQPTSETMPAQAADDNHFVKEAALSGMAEVELGKLAAEKGSTDAIKQFGQRLVDDHTKANDELKQAAAADKIEVPDALDAKDQSRIDKLGKLSGPEFDRAFLKEELKGHQRDVSEFQSESRNGADANVKSFASKTLPTLEAHLDTVKQLKANE